MKKKYLLIAIIIISIIIKVCFFNYISNDYKNFISKWIEIMKNNGGIFSLKMIFADYNYPYLIFLAIISYLPINPIYLIKTLSLIFDLLIAMLGYKFVSKYSSSKEINPFLCCIYLLINPVIFINSSLWGQCDSIYSFFVLLSIYYLCDKKVNKAFIALGIAFSLKLQAIFIFPLFVIMFFCNKKIKIYHFLIIPLVNFIMCIPAYVVGGSPLYTYNVYFFQTVEYLNLDFDLTNIYSFLPNNQLLITVGIITTLCIFAGLLLYYHKKRDNISDYSILNFALLSFFICFFFLPCMHERYSYLIDIYAIILACIYSKKYYIPIITNVCSIILYVTYLINLYMPKYILELLTIIYFIAVFSHFKTTIEEIKAKKNMKVKTIKNSLKSS